MLHVKSCIAFAGMNVVVVLFNVFNLTLVTPLPKLPLLFVLLIAQALIAPEVTVINCCSVKVAVPKRLVIVRVTL